MGRGRASQEEAQRVGAGGCSRWKEGTGVPREEEEEEEEEESEDGEEEDDITSAESESSEEEEGEQGDPQNATRQQQLEWDDSTLSY